MTAEEMWIEYTAAHPDAENSCYDAWSYGGYDPDELAGLTRAGIKTATASAYPCYEAEGEELPEAGEYNVILGSDGEAVCITVTDSVTVIPFCDVGEDQAYCEGEGDRSLAYWRSVHADIFASDMASDGLVFTEDMPVVCERFHSVYPER